LGTNYSWGGI